MHADVDPPLTAVFSTADELSAPRRSPLLRRRLPAALRCRGPDRLSPSYRPHLDAAPASFITFTSDREWNPRPAPPDTSPFTNFGHSRVASHQGRDS